MSLYGTRDAAANFQAEVKKFMCRAGFVQGRYNPCTYWHPIRNIKALVHGDDFVGVGAKDQLDWFNRIIKGRFEVKVVRVGSGSEAVEEARVLNRVIRCTQAGWEMEADQRHADLLIKGLCLEQAKGVGTPGEDEKPWEEEGGDAPLRLRQPGVRAWGVQ